MSKKILFLSNHFMALYSSRRELIQQLVMQGHSVYISLPKDKRNDYFEDMGCHIIETKIVRRGLNPVEDLRLVLQYIGILKRLQPDIIFSYTVKPNIYGSIASNILHIKQICNITGTGATFLSDGFLSKIVRMLYRFSIRNCYKVFFQNTGDQDYFVQHGLVRNQYEILPGSGVNLDQHAFCEMPDDGEVKFIFIGRVMAVKGIDQYLSCAKKIKAQYPNTQFYIAGFNEEVAYQKPVDECVNQGYVDYIGFQEDIDPWIQRCHCTILPSLGGEGVPNALLESAAIGRACIASSINGSKEVVVDRVTGYLFTPGDSTDLICCVEEFLKLSLSEKRAMGLAGYRHVAEKFNRELVIQKYEDEVAKTVTFIDKSPHA